MVKNTAFVFLKPHAVTDKAKEEVTTFFESKNIKITKEGSIPAEQIDKKKLIDQHYYAIASKATLLKPTSLNIPKHKFKEFFNEDFDTVVKEGKILNAADACIKLDVDAAGLDKLWAEAKKNKKLVKFGGGFYCALVEPRGGEPLYTFNGFFMEMRSKFVAPGTEVYYYVVEFDSKDVSWADFRGKVLGPTDPSEAPKDSLRGIFMNRWKELELKFEPNVGDNAVHASASPFEALAERMNWLGYRPERDAFGKQLLKVASRSQIRDWAVDPQVTYGPVSITKSIFDSLEDTDTDYCLALCQMIALGTPTKSPGVEQLKKDNEKLQQELEQYRQLGDALKVMLSFNHGRK
eukprot:GEMP01012224.1.p1 GENE.GEMP01012224.1~~GEMP01012224.1.p1  ORF type:complete len:349 (+),score=84.25 GEMP01012224.1:124-1170(+)